MNFPGMPGGGGGGLGGNNAAGMNDQEAVIVKAVSLSAAAAKKERNRKKPILIKTADAISYGELPSKDSDIWRDGVCSRWRFRPVHELCKCRPGRHSCMG